MMKLKKTYSRVIVKLKKRYYPPSLLLYNGISVRKSYKKGRYVSQCGSDKYCEENFEIEECLQ